RPAAAHRAHRMAQPATSPARLSLSASLADSYDNQPGNQDVPAGSPGPRGRRHSTIRAISENRGDHPTTGAITAGPGTPARPAPSSLPDAGPVADPADLRLALGRQLTGVR